MTEEEQLILLSQITGETERDAVSAYLLLAKNAVLQKLYPFGDGTEELPEKYRSMQVEIAAYLLNKRGAEGEVAHSENGVSRTYEDGDVPPSLLRRILPMAGAL